MTEEHAKQIIVCLKSIAVSLSVLASSHQRDETISPSELNKQLAACKEKPVGPKFTDNQG